MEKEIKRTANCGELRLSDEGKEVSVVGWVSKKRNLGSLMFIDLRDRTGIVQVNVKTDEIDVPDVRNEYILNVTGVVTKKEVANSKINTTSINFTSHIN